MTTIPESDPSDSRKRARTPRKKPVAKHAAVGPHLPKVKKKAKVKRKHHPMQRCMVCKQTMKVVSPAHLRTHGLTGSRYARMYGAPPLTSPSSTQRMSTTDPELAKTVGERLLSDKVYLSTLTSEVGERMINGPLKTRLSMLLSTMLHQRAHVHAEAMAILSGSLQELKAAWRISQGGPGGAPTSTAELLDITRAAGKLAEDAENSVARAIKLALEEQKAASEYADGVGPSLYSGQAEKLGGMADLPAGDRESMRILVRSLARRLQSEQQRPALEATFSPLASAPGDKLDVARLDVTRPDADKLDGVDKLDGTDIGWGARNTSSNLSPQEGSSSSGATSSSEITSSSGAASSLSPHQVPPVAPAPPPGARDGSSDVPSTGRDAVGRNGCGAPPLSKSVRDSEDSDYPHSSFVPQSDAPSSNAASFVTARDAKLDVPSPSAKPATRKRALHTHPAKKAKPCKGIVQLDALGGALPPPSPPSAGAAGELDWSLPGESVSEGKKPKPRRPASKSKVSEQRAKAAGAKRAKGVAGRQENKATKKTQAKKARKKKR